MYYGIEVLAIELAITLADLLPNAVLLTQRIGRHTDEIVQQDFGTDSVNASNHDAFIEEVANSLKTELEAKGTRLTFACPPPSENPSAPPFSSHTFGGVGVRVDALWLNERNVARVRMWLVQKQDK